MFATNCGPFQGKFNRWLALSSLLLILGLCCLEVRADTKPLVLTGQVAPGTEGARFASFVSPIVNTSGDVVFTADLAGGASSSGVFKISNGAVAPVVLQGQLKPDSGKVFGGMGNAFINGVGDVVFTSSSGPDEAIFIASGEAIRKLVDDQTPVPGAPGQSFSRFSNVLLNDPGDIAFFAFLNGGPVLSGIFMISQNVMRAVALNIVGASLTVEPGSLNNHGDLVFVSNQGLSLFSNGSVTTIAIAGEPIPDSGLFVHATSPWIDDEKDIVFVNYDNYDTVCGTTCIHPNAIVRWRSGRLEMIVSRGSGILAGNRLIALNICCPQVNPFGVLVSGRLKIEEKGLIAGIIGVVQGAPVGASRGMWKLIASEDQFIEGIGTTDSIGDAHFDQQNKFVTYVASTRNGSPTPLYAGIYATTPNQLTFSLFFPQMADGGGPRGAWRTTFNLANRSDAPSTATISFYDDDGAPMTLSVDGQRQSQFQVSIPRFGVAQFKTDGVGALKTGWATVQADQSVAGLAVFSFFNDAGAFVDEVGAPSTTPLPSMSMFAQVGASTSTAVAIANPNSTSTGFRLLLTDSSYQTIADASFTLPAMGHLAKYVPELFPGIAWGDFNGKIVVQSGRPLGVDAAAAGCNIHVRARHPIKRNLRRTS